MYLNVNVMDCVYVYLLCLLASSVLDELVLTGEPWTQRQEFTQSFRGWRLLDVNSNSESINFSLEILTQSFGCQFLNSGPNKWTGGYYESYCCFNNILGLKETLSVERCYWQVATCCSLQLLDCCLSVPTINGQTVLLWLWFRTYTNKTFKDAVTQCFLSLTLLDNIVYSTYQNTVAQTCPVWTLLSFKLKLFKFYANAQDE